MKQLHAILLAGAWTLAAAVHAQPGPQLVNGIDVMVNDSIITVQDVQLSIASVLPSLRGRGEAEAAVIEREKRDQLVQLQLVLSDFKTKGYNLPESLINEEVERTVRDRYQGDRVLFIKTLKAQGTTYEAFCAHVREEFIYSAMRYKNVSQDLIVSPAKIAKYYAEHQDKFRAEDQVKLRMIVLNRTGGVEDVSRRKLAEEILTQLNEGADFGEMAQIHSDGSARAQRGDLGWVDRNFSREEYINVAFGLPAGQRSGVIERPEAYYLLWVEDKRAAHLQPLSEVHNEIEQTLLVQEQARLEKKWVDRLKAKAFIRYYN